MPALDGLRGAAVAAVVAYHFGVPGTGGGYLGVDVFFVLSGFLITTLLLAEHARTGRIGLRAFWARRARRLLPGLGAMLLAVAVWAAVVGLSSPATVRGDAIATLGYLANWRYILANRGYFAQYGPPSPLLHTWSLAIEEQFYLLWPLIVLPVVRRWGARAVRDVAVGGVLASATACAVLAARGADTARLYYGTDTRAQAILVGAALAATLRLRRHRSGTVPAPVVASVVPVLGAVCVLWCWHALSGTSAFLYRGGFTLVAAATATVIAGAVTTPRAVLTRVLSWSPLRGLGHISYEVYLWHWPVLLAMTASRTGGHGSVLLAARVAVTGGLALGTWALIDQPLRRPSARVRRLPSLVPALALAAVIVAVATIGATIEPPTQARPSLHLAAAALTPAALTPLGPTAGSVRDAASPVRAVLLGDSVALTLGEGLLDEQAAYGVQTVDGGLVGCGVLGAGTVRVQGQAVPVVPGCANWERGWRGLVAQVRPDVAAILVGRWEVVDREMGGRWTHVGEPAFDAFVGAQLDKAIDDAGSSGAPVVLLTAPHFAGLERPDGGRWPEDDPARVDRFNALLRAAAARHRGTTVFDLGALAEPVGHYTATIDGVTVRRADGIHFTEQGADLLAPAVMGALTRAARG